MVIFGINVVSCPNIIKYSEFKVIKVKTGSSYQSITIGNTFFLLLPLNIDQNIFQKKKIWLPIPWTIEITEVVYIAVRQFHQNLFAHISKFGKIAHTL